MLRIGTPVIVEREGKVFGRVVGIYKEVTGVKYEVLIVGAKHYKIKARLDEITVCKCWREND